MDEKQYIWEWPDPTISELRRFVERDVGKYFINALRDVGVALGFMSILNECPPILIWFNDAKKLTAIPKRIEEALFHIDQSRHAPLNTFPSLDRMELEAARGAISIVMVWLRNEFPSAGVEYLPDDFGS